MPKKNFLQARVAFHLKTERIKKAKLIFWFILFVMGINREHDTWNSVRTALQFIFRQSKQDEMVRRRAIPKINMGLNRDCVTGIMCGKNNGIFWMIMIIPV